jgi:hypothetical protein
LVIEEIVEGFVEGFLNGAWDPDVIERHGIITNDPKLSHRTMCDVNRDSGTESANGGWHHRSGAAQSLGNCRSSGSSPAMEL